MSEHLGIMHFLEMMQEYHPKWIIAAAKAPVDQVSDCLVKLTKAKHCLKNIPIRGVVSDGVEETSNMECPWTAVVQPKSNNWSVVFLGERTWARILAERLNTRAVILGRSDVSAGTGYEIYESGHFMEMADWDPDNEMFYDSTIRPKPELDFLDVDENEKTYDEERNTTHNEQIFHQFVDSLFRNEGIYIPTCWPRGDDEDSYLIVEKWSTGVIERADLIDIPS